VPGGVSRRNAKMPSARPAALRTIVGTSSPVVNPIVNRPDPSATMIASGSRPRRAASRDGSAGGGASAMACRAPSVSAPASAMSGSRPRKTYRQPTVSPTVPAIAGPMTPGRTQAVDSVANMRGRSFSGRVRPMAT
jgi:hypothetical protein